MKLEQQQQAQTLYFQTDLSKTEIANLLGVSRASLHSWVRRNNWERLKKSSAHMPSLVAENCYMIMSKLTDSILSELRMMRPITKAESETMRNVAVTIKHLKNRSTVNESLEMMTFFIEHVNRKDPKMALEMKPFINDYIASRAAVQPWQFMHEKFNDLGHIPATPDAEKAAKQLTEDQLDLQDIMAWSQNQESSEDHTPPSPPVERAGERQPAPSTAEDESTVRHTPLAPLVERAGERQPAPSTAEGKPAVRNIPPSPPVERAGVRSLNRAQRRELARHAKAAA